MKEKVLTAEEEKRWVILEPDVNDCDPGTHV